MKEALTAMVSGLTDYDLRLTTSSANIPSQRLAQAAGFECIGVIKGDRVSEKFGVCDTLVYHRIAR
jgi:RimJ/RimL family protein N-acetyltransferase